MNNRMTDKIKPLSFKQRIKDMDKQLLIVTIILIIIGVLSIVSASSRETVSRYEYSVYHFFIKQMTMLGAALIGAFLIFLFPTKSYRFFGPLLWFTIIVCLFALFIYDSIKRGSNNWLPTGGQPSEFAKPIMIVVLAILFENMSNKDLEDKKTGGIFVAKWIVLGMFLPIIVFLQGDLGTALIMTGIAGFMYLFSPLGKKIKWTCLIGMVVLALIGGGILYASRGYLLTKEQMSRFDYFNPCAKDKWQECNGLIAINKGGLTGLGLGKSQQKYSYIPDPHTDSIFAIIVEEAGLGMGILIICLYAWMLLRIAKIAINASTIRGRYIAFGAFAYLALHVIFNLGGLLAILPLTGVPLPLISYGGSFTISFIAMLTMVQCVAAETKNKRIRISSNL